MTLVVGIKQSGSDPLLSAELGNHAYIIQHMIKHNLKIL